MCIKLSILPASMAEESEQQLEYEKTVVWSPNESMILSIARPVPH